MCSSCVYANDTNETTDINTEISNINVPSLDISHHSVNATFGSFDELKSNIESLNPGILLLHHVLPLKQIMLQLTVTDILLMEIIIQYHLKLLVIMLKFLTGDFVTVRVMVKH